jgi:hypothetical protein
MVHTPRHHPAPPELIRNQKEWTDRFCKICAGEKHGNWATGQAHRVIRKAVHPIAHGKCIYCERVLELKRDLEVDQHRKKAR